MFLFRILFPVRSACQRLVYESADGGYVFVTAHVIEYRLSPPATLLLGATLGRYAGPKAAGP
jgi:hypothetical protein